jgi:hypothetical protein
VKSLNPILFSALAVFLVAALAFDDAPAGKWKGKMVKKDGVLHVMNPAEPLDGKNTYELKELWRLGGETDDEDEIFGIITRILTDKDGNVYLLDTQLSEIKVFSPDGEFIRTIGRKGEGPGEFQTPVGMFFTPGGDIAVMQVAPGKIVLLSPEGEPRGEHPIPKLEGSGFLIINNGRYQGGNLVLALSVNAFEAEKFSQKQYLASIAEDGSEKAHYYEETLMLDFSNAVMDDSKWNNFKNRWTLGADGRVYSNVTYDDYTINVWRPDGTLDRIIEREYKHHERSEVEKNRMINIFKAFTRQVPNAKFKISDYASDIEQIHAREDGTIWVVSSNGARDLPEGVIATFDVFDKNGIFTRQVSLKGEGRPLFDGFYFVGNRLYVVTGLLQAAIALQAGGQAVDLGDEEEPKPMEVICYELDKDLWLSKN